MIALAVYLCFIIAMIGGITQVVVEPPVREKLQNHLDLRTQLLARKIDGPLSNSQGLLYSLRAIANTELVPSGAKQNHLRQLLIELFSGDIGAVVSGGIWPEPYSIDPNERLSSLFFNRHNGQVDQIFSYNNPQSSPYHEESWYTAVVNKPSQTVVWSDVYIDSFTHVQMITASMPYYHHERFAGVVTIDLSLKELMSLVKKHAEEYQLGVVVRDNYGTLITEHKFDIHDGIYISHYRFDEFNWQLSVINSERLVDDEVFSQVVNIELAIIPMLLMCVMAGYYLINRYLLKPITDIGHKVGDSQAGGIIDIDYSSKDEIGQLIEAFNNKTVYLEAEKRKAQASTDAKTAFLATLSHEIRTPMNGVLGTAQLLLKTELDDTQKKYLRMLYDSGDHMMKLLNEILDFSKIEQGKLELDETQFPLESLIGSINSVYFSLCQEKGLGFKVYSDIAKDRWYLSDKARLRQILFNLLNNAFKFTSHGFIEVFLSEYEQQGTTYLLIRVRDSGIGIPKEAQQRIFNPFEQVDSTTTRQFGGTGLGLAIVKQIVELMGGYMTLTSELNIGTSFEVHVAVETCMPIVIEQNSHHKLDYSGLKVLIVEDNRTNTIIIETFMKNKGFTCRCVTNGQLAIEAVMEEAFDLILMDNHMPVMDGVESISGIRQMPGPMKDVLIFGCTADVFKETRDRMLGAGADSIVAKPINERELDDALYLAMTKLYQFQPDDSVNMTKL
nr:ATP-binding protein [Vibrio sp. 10N.286.49.B3]